MFNDSKGVVHMENNNACQEKINNLINRVNNLSEEQFDKYINLLYREGLISLNNGQQYLHQD